MKQRVRFNRKAITLDVKATPNYTYQIDLERCTNAAGLLDHLLQIQMKTWCTPDLFNEVIECLRDTAWTLFGNTLQGLVCPFGQSVYADWKRAARSGKTYPPPPELRTIDLSVFGDA